MEQFNPTVLRVDATRERWEAAENVISLADLILRWPYHAIINIPYELHWDIYDNKINEDNPPLALYLRDDVVTGLDGQKVLRLRPIHINTAFKPFLTNIQNIFVLRNVVERLEAQHPNYAAQRPLEDGEHRLLLANTENTTEIMLYILQAWRRALEHKQAIKSGDDLNSKFWLEIQSDVDKDLPLVPERLPSLLTDAEPKDTNVTQPPVKTAELPPQGLSTNPPKTKEEAKKFLSVFELNAPAQRLIAFEAFFDAGYPRFKNKVLGALFHPDSQQCVEPKTLVSYGSRLCRSLRENKGKTWQRICPPDCPPVHN